jgi:hypothetical protein
VYAGDKASADLTEASNHKLWDNDGKVFYEGCKIITRLVEEACKVAEFKLATVI